MASLGAAILIVEELQESKESIHSSTPLIKLIGETAADTGAERTPSQREVDRLQQDRDALLIDLGRNVQRVGELEVFLSKFVELQEFLQSAQHMNRFEDTNVTEMSNVLKEASIMATSITILRTTATSTSSGRAFARDSAGTDGEEVEVVDEEGVQYDLDVLEAELYSIWQRETAAQESASSSEGGKEPSPPTRAQVRSLLQQKVDAERQVIGLKVHISKEHLRGRAHTLTSISFLLRFSPSLTYPRRAISAIRAAASALTRQRTGSCRTAQWRRSSGT
jgi:hypothetical protein